MDIMCDNFRMSCVTHLNLSIKQIEYKNRQTDGQAGPEIGQLEFRPLKKEKDSLDGPTFKIVFVYYAR